MIKNVMNHAMIMSCRHESGKGKSWLILTNHRMPKTTGIHNTIRQDLYVLINHHRRAVPSDMLPYSTRVWVHGIEIIHHKRRSTPAINHIVPRTIHCDLYWVCSIMFLPQGIWFVTVSRAMFHSQYVLVLIVFRIRLQIIVVIVCHVCFNPCMMSLTKIAVGRILSCRRL